MTAPRKRGPNRGSFKPGPDKRRHVFTREECVEGFWRALEKVATDEDKAHWVDRSGRHASVNFLKWALKRRGRKG